MLSRIPDPIFSPPDPRLKRFRILIKEFKYLKTKIVSKLSEISSGMFIPDLDIGFLPIPDPGV
jgi:hypothetical protein